MHRFATVVLTSASAARPVRMSMAAKVALVPRDDA